MSCCSGCKAKAGKRDTTPAIRAKEKQALMKKRTAQASR